MKNEFTVRAKGVGDDIKGFISSQLESNSVPVKFSNRVKSICMEGPSPISCKSRRDLRDMPALTIDCDSTQDRDDSISIQKTAEGYLLGVHIADVSSFVPFGSVLDAEAADRGSSIYLPGMTIPMLPECLSNDLCSLNPGEDRNAISILISLDRNCEVMTYSVTKSVIRSRVKGVYSEVNDLLQSKCSSALLEKYSCVKDDLFTLLHIEEVLRSKRENAGARLTCNDEVVACVNENELSLVESNHGTAGLIIEELMVLANALMAEFFSGNGLPAVYRAQRQTETQAFYTSELCLHADLALGKYLTFTSPIRRHADLTNHQILSMYLEGCSPECIHFIFDPILDEICELATKRFRRAANLQYVCKKYCITKFFTMRKNGKYSGVVSGYNANGIPVVTLERLPVSVYTQKRASVKLGELLLVEVRTDPNEKLYAVPISMLAA